MNPNLIAGLSSCTGVATSDYHSCAICAGEVYCWGDHRFGAVGAGPLTNAAVIVPQRVDLELVDETWSQLVAGYGFTCALTTKGRAYCWGYSPYGALGSGGATSPLPIAVLIEY